MSFLSGVGSTCKVIDYSLLFLWTQGHYLACMTAILKQMEDAHYAQYISTFKTRQDIIVSLPLSPQEPSIITDAERAFCAQRV